MMLCRAYRATPEQLGLHEVARVRQLSRWSAELIGYGHHDAGVTASGRQEGADPMTTDAGRSPRSESPSSSRSWQNPRAARWSTNSPKRSRPLPPELQQAPVPVLFKEVRAARNLLAQLLPPGTDSTELHRQVGRLSGLLGNLAFHTWTTWPAHAPTWAPPCHTPTGAVIRRWRRGLTGRRAWWPATPRGAAAAPAGLIRAQLHAWALLPTLAQQGRDREATAALDVAVNEIEADPAGQAPDRFGFDEAELALHQAEAHLTLDRTDQARAEAAAAACTAGTPGWAAATLVLAQAEASDQPSDAAQRALDILDRVPPSRLRATARTRLQRLEGLLAAHPAEYVADLCERLRTLPPPVDASGAASA